MQVGLEDKGPWLGLEHRVLEGCWDRLTRQDHGTLRDRQGWGDRNHHVLRTGHVPDTLYISHFSQATPVFDRHGTPTQVPRRSGCSRLWHATG